MTEPSPGEIMRRLDDLIKAQERLTTRLEKLVEDIADDYVSKGEYLADHRTADLRFAQIERRQEGADALKRQVIGGFAVGFLLILINAVGVLISASAIGG